MHIILIFLAFVFAADCPTCQKSLADFKTQATEIENAIKMLKTNEDELAKVPSDQVSKRVKFGSNVFMWKVKLETLENNNTVLATTINKDCTTCGIPAITVKTENPQGAQPQNGQ